MENPTCKTCGAKLVIRETQQKASQLRKAYYYRAYFYCNICKKIYHDEKFKIINDNLFSNVNRETIQEDDRAGNSGFDVEIWTDGACVFNGQANARAAWAFVAGKHEGAGLVDGVKQTNNVAEGLAILKALEWAVENNFKKIKIHTDSQITIHNLKKPASQIKQNREIFSDIEKLIMQNNLKVHYEKVLGHSGDVNNERADSLANNLASYKSV